METRWLDSEDVERLRQIKEFAELKENRIYKHEDIKDEDREKLKERFRVLEERCEKCQKETCEGCDLKGEYGDILLSMPTFIKEQSTQLFDDEFHVTYIVEKGKPENGPEKIYRTCRMWWEDRRKVRWPEAGVVAKVLYEDVLDKFGKGWGYQLRYTEDAGGPGVMMWMYPWDGDWEGATAI